MSAAGVGELYFIEGNMNSNMYCEVLQQSMIPSLQKLGRISPTVWNSTGNSTQLASVQFVGLILPSNIPRGDMDTPPRLRNFFRYLAIGMCHFRYLWNGLCDRHRAEITVMQLTGHSLPVHQSISVPWVFF